MKQGKRGSGKRSAKSAPERQGRSTGSRNRRTRQLVLWVFVLFLSITLLGSYALVFIPG